MIPGIMSNSMDLITSDVLLFPFGHKNQDKHSMAKQRLSAILLSNKSDG